MPDNILAGALPYNSWTGQTAMSPIRAIKVAWTNWAVLSGAETVSGGPVYLTAAIEFPLGGTITRLTFNGGATSVVIADGAEGVTDLVQLPRTIPCMTPGTVVSFDAATNTITRTSGSWLSDEFRVGDTVFASTRSGTNNGPIGAITTLSDTVMKFATGVNTELAVAGATVCGHYRIRSFWQQQGAGGLPYSPYGPYPSTKMGDQSNQNAVDSTLAPTLVAGSFFGMWPQRIMAFTSRRNDLCLIEDSRGEGYGENSFVDSAFRGQSQLCLGRNHATFRLCGAGSTASGFVAGPTRRLRLANLAPPTTIQLVLGINDFASQSAAQVQANLQTIAAYFPRALAYLGTISPRTTSSNNWQDLPGQTLDPNNGKRVTVNTWVRALTTGTIPNFTGYFDITSFQESGLNSGLWAVTGATGQAAFTTDGLHATTLGDNAVNIFLPPPLP